MSDSTKPGGCICGSIRYEVDASTVLGQAHCHCRDCQRATGSAIATFGVVPEAGFRLLGAEPRGFEVKGESGGRVRRFFCEKCGSQLYSQVDAMPGVFFVKSGSLDDAGWMAPSLALWSVSAQPWTPAMPEGVTSFDRNPG